MRRGQVSENWFTRTKPLKIWKRLREFIAVHNPSAAGRIGYRLVSKIELLPDFPGMGTPVENGTGCLIPSATWFLASMLFAIQYM